MHFDLVPRFCMSHGPLRQAQLLMVALTMCPHRSILPDVAKEYPLPAVKTTWTVEKALKGWDAAQAKFFAVRVLSGAPQCTILTLTP